MIENLEISILWLSDIHFSSLYKDKENLRKWYQERKVELINKDIDKPKLDDSLNKLTTEYNARLAKLPHIEAYINNFIKTLKNYPKKINYVLLSGDLVSTASEEDYISFFNCLIKKIKKVVSNETIFIAVPGNHDVFWENTSFFDKLLDEMSKLYDLGKKNFSGMRNEYLNRRKEYFNQIFSNYSNFFCNYLNYENWQKELFVKYYDQNGIMGYLIDVKNNLAINFLNSSWYALGKKFDSILLDAFLRKYEDEIFSTINLEKDTAKKEFKEWFKRCLIELITVKNHSLEYGGQIMGVDKKQEEEIFDLPLKESNYFVITIFHHPLNWLDYREKYAWDLDKNNNLFLNRLLRRTELLLTGHEHVPASVGFENISSGALHLKAGMFMQDDMFEEPVGQHRFSILEINTTKYKLNELKYIYDDKVGYWIFDKKFSIFNKYINKKQPVFSNTNLDKFIGYIESKKIFIEILQKYFLIGEDLKAEYEHSRLHNSSNYNIETFSKKGKVKRAIVIVKNFDFFDKYLKKKVTKGNEHIITTILKKLGSFDNKLKLMILVPDFLVSGNRLADYLNENVRNKFSIYYKIVKEGDFIFNIARHRFFNQFENKIMNNTAHTDLICDEINFNDIRDIQLSCQIVPFWIIEKFAPIGK